MYINIQKEKDAESERAYSISPAKIPSFFYVITQDHEIQNQGLIRAQQ